MSENTLSKKIEIRSLTRGEAIARIQSRQKTIKEIREERAAAEVRSFFRSTTIVLAMFVILLSLVTIFGYSH